MAESEVPARTKAKRKRCATPLDPDEVAERIVDELEKSREGIDKNLAKYSDSILQAQSNKRQRFIDYCESEIRGLPNGIKSLVATKLLSSEDFAVNMNFSELHTSSSKSSLTWSCGDASLSDPSWRKLLQQYVKGAAVSSSPSTRELAQRPQAARKSSSPPARPSLPISKPARPSTSTAMAEDYEDPYVVPEDQDPLAISYVTISKTRSKTNTGPQVAPRSHKSGTRKQRRGTFGQAKPSKNRRITEFWTQQEIDVLKSLCYGNPEARRTPKSAFWASVEAQLPGRSAQACRSKWVLVPEAKLNYGSGKKTWYAVKAKRKAWSREELELLKQARPRPGKPINWERAQAFFPDRTRSSIANELRYRFGPIQMWSKGHPSGLSPNTAADVSGESTEGDGAKRDDGNEIEADSNGGSL